MNIFLQCISCGNTKSRTHSEAVSAPLVPQPYLSRSQSLDRSYRRRRFRSASSVDYWLPSLTAISEEPSDCSSHGDRKDSCQVDQQKRFVVRSEKMKRSRSCGKSRVRSDSFGCRYRTNFSGEFFYVFYFSSTLCIYVDWLNSILGFVHFFGNIDC